MANHWYVLTDSGEPVKGDWENWWSPEHERLRIVAQTTISSRLVSTVFLGLDHNFGQGPPVLWETMVFNGADSEDCERCSGSREQAMAMHERMVAKIKGDSCSP